MTDVTWQVLLLVVPMAIICLWMQVIRDLPIFLIFKSVFLKETEKTFVLKSKMLMKDRIRSIYLRNINSSFFWEQIIEGKGEDTVIKDYKSFINTSVSFLSCLSTTLSCHQMKNLTIN